MAVDQSYIGQELTIFAHAINWKRYYTSILQSYLGRRVVEVGAGLGATTQTICDGSQEEWICLEPDPALRSQIDLLISSRQLPPCCVARGGQVSGLETTARFDSFVYIDVLEHIADDRAELESAAARLVPGGRLIVLSPAFNFLYSPFDRSIGHHRRYDKGMYRALTPPGCTIEKMTYLDSLGTATSLVNRFLLTQSLPTVEQILFWDRQLIPLTKWLDRLVGYSFGRSLLGIWVKNEH